MVAQNVVLTGKDSNPTLSTIYEEQLDRIDLNLEQLFSYLKEYPESQLNLKPTPDAWSALQVCNHLFLAEEHSLRYLKKKLSFNPKLKKANMATTMRIKLLKTYLNTPVKFKAPENIGTDALPETSVLQEVMDSWLALRKELRVFLSELSDDIHDKEVYKHPFAGRLSLEGMLVFFEEHLHRHTKQIKKTLRRVG